MRRLAALVPALLLTLVSGGPTPAPVPVPAQPEAAPAQPEALPTTFGVFSDQSVDYTAHIIVLTGRKLGTDTRCGITTDTFQCVLVPLNGGPALISDIMIADDAGAPPIPGSRFVASGQSNCDSNAAVILTQLAPSLAPLSTTTVDEMAAPEGLTTLGFFTDTTIDYSAHLILLTGKSFGFGRLCFEDGEFRQVVLIPIDGGPALVSTMLIVDPFFDWKTGTRYHALGQFNCGASIAQVILTEI